MTLNKVYFNEDRNKQFDVFNFSPNDFSNSVSADFVFFVYSLTEKNFLTRRLFLIISCYISYRLALLKKTLKRSYPKMEWNALRIFLLSYLLLLHIRLLFRSILDFLKRKKLNSWGKKSLFSLCTEQYSHCI